MTSKGFAIITTVLILPIVFAFSLLILTVILSRSSTGRSLHETLSAEQIAEAGIHKAIFCLNAPNGTNCGGAYGASYAGETDVAFGGGTFTTTVTGGVSEREATSVGATRTGRARTIKVTVTTVPPTDEMAFSYALQCGGGGARLENNSGITGTIYSNGDVICQSTAARVSGDAYSAKADGRIDRCRIDFHAHADKILDSIVGGDAYYENDPADIAGTTVAGIKYAGSATPEETALPAVDLQFWRDSAEAGGVIIGDHHPADNSDLGPIKIAGDLVMDNNVDVTIKGPLWVTGNLLTGNNSSFTLHPSFEGYSTVILADDPEDNVNHGKVDITNNTGIYGSGDPTSHILFISTNTSVSDTAPAMSVANNATGAIFYATAGTLRLQNNAGAKSLAGYRLFLDQNAIVTYAESEMSGQFSNSPAGIWRLKEGTWRQVQ